MLEGKSARALLLLPLFAAVFLLSGAGQPAPQRLLQFTPEQQSELDKVNAYLNGIQTLKSNFVQLGPQGQLDQGTFYLQKPGKLRFSYAAPSPTLVVATDGEVFIRNARLNTVNSYHLSDTPLGLLLDQNINLKNNKSVLGVELQNDALVVHARTSPNRAQSNITLVFSYPEVALRQWMVTDNQGGTTTVALTGTQMGVSLDPALFDVPVKAPRKSGG